MVRFLVWLQVRSSLCVTPLFEAKYYYVIRHMIDIRDIEDGDCTISPSHAYGNC